MNIQLSDHFTYRRLIRFTLPSIAMMIFTSIYGVVDGLFVSNFVGETSFAAINFIMPFLMILGSFGFMFGTGGSALIAKTLGEGDREKAHRLFSMLTYISLAIGTVIAVIGIPFLEPICAILGADGQMLDECVIYGRIILLALPAFMLQQEFQSFFVVAEKPQLGLFTTIASGITNMVLDAFFIAVFEWGVAGAAIATALSQAVGGIVPVFYFFSKNTSLLRLTKSSFDVRALLKTCTNGSSEFLSNAAMSLVGLLYNVQLMHYAGQPGVAAYGVMMYVGWIFVSIYVGYSIGTSPIAGYNFGSGNRNELKSFLRKSAVIVASLSIAMFIISELLAYPLSYIFMNKSPDVLKLTVHGFRIFSFQFLFCGIAIFGSGFFTALNNGLVSAIISFLRTLVFQLGSILLLPLIWSPPVDGIWVSVVAAEAIAAILSIIFIFAKRKKYGYI